MTPVAFPPAFAMPLLSGDAGVEQTINEMRALVDEAIRDSSFIRIATDIVRSVPAFDDYAEANALYEWVRRNIRFTKDPVNKEKLYPPMELLKIRAGDCDDISMLMGALLMAVGYPARLMTVAASAGSPEQFSHVYVEGEVPAGSGQWVPMDPARSDSQFGIAPRQIYRARWWSLTDSEHGDLSGTRARRTSLHGLGYIPRYRSHAMSGLGSYGRVRTMGVFGSAPDPTSVQELVNNGYNPTTIQQLIAMGASNEQLESLPFPASAAEMQASVNALVAQLGGSAITIPPVQTPAAAAASGAVTSSMIATTGQSIASIIRAGQGQPASPFDYSASGPWSSFQTQYSPQGSALPPAGYGSPAIALTSTSNIGLWIALGLGALLFMGARK